MNVRDFGVSEVFLRWMLFLKKKGGKKYMLKMGKDYYFYDFYVVIF